MRHPYRTSTVQLPLPSERDLLARQMPRFTLTALTVIAVALVALAVF